MDEDFDEYGLHEADRNDAQDWEEEKVFQDLDLDLNLEDGEFSDFGDFGIDGMSPDGE